jgi:heme A synthase
MGRHKVGPFNGRLSDLHVSGSLVALRRVSLVSAVMAFALVVWGAVVRVNGAGMTCPDWPRCQGRWLPALDNPTFYEWSHRLGALAVTAIILATFVTAFVARKEARAAFAVSCASLGLIVAQIAAGALTIVLHNNPPSVAIHLVLGFLTFISLLIVAVIASLTAPANSARRAIAKAPASFAALSLVTTLLAFAAIFAAGLMSAANDGLACIGFPLCNGWEGAATDAQMIHMDHRFAAYATVIAVIVTFVVAQTGKWAARDIKSLSSIAFALVIVQVALGVAAVVSRLNPIVRIAHEANGALLAGSLVLLTVSAFRKPVPA